jgi:hypothetical protein
MVATSSAEDGRIADDVRIGARKSFAGPLRGTYDEP